MFARANSNVQFVEELRDWKPIEQTHTILNVLRSLVELNIIEPFDR